MVSVCRFCARWAEGVVRVDDILLDNLLHAKDAVKQMFGIDLSCVPPYPSQVCPECVQYLHSSSVFLEQLQNAERVFQALQERGQLVQRLSERKSAGVALHFEDMAEEDPATLLPQNGAQVNEESVYGNADGEEEGSFGPAQPSERVIQISIEAIEELEIISSPLESIQVTINDRSPSTQRMQSSVDECENENHAPAVERQRSNGSVRQERVNVSQRRPMAEACPPGQRANGTVTSNKCYVCFRVYGTEAELMAHLIEHNDLLPYRCEQCSTIDCPFEFRTNQALNKHLEAHCYPFKCAECQLRFRRRSKINEHIRAVHLHKKLYVCKRCGMEFHELRKFRLHMIAHRNIEMGRYQTANGTCDREKLVQPRSSRPHFHCEQCNCGFKYHANYKLHRKHHHQPAQHLFRCTEVWCDKYYATYREWRRHMKLHFPNGSIPFAFEILPDSLQNPNVYPLACPEPACPYVAPALPQMCSHYYVHLKWFQCRRCDKLYSNLTGPCDHHERVRRFKC
ncbi:zinc finger protein 879-like [Anopheles stephensi]|uniref:Uncharacterized protein n=1 Tax=Anopheles stephensi TaxID=30069 RepID=A0A182YFH6_ANOST|nr:zinc finger protein 879-like [Anopheles stephensi]